MEIIAMIYPDSLFDGTKTKVEIILNAVANAEKFLQSTILIV